MDEQPSTPQYQPQPAESALPAQSQATPSPQPQPAPTHEMPGAFALFGPSINALKVNIRTLLAIIGLVALTAVIAVLIVRNVTGTAGSPGNSAALTPASLLGILFFVAVTAIVGPAVAYVQLKSAKGIKTSLSEALSTGAKYLLRYLALSILTSLIVGIGFLLLIIPGFIMLRRYYLAMYFLIDQDTGVLEAMRKSAESTKPYSWKVYGIMGVNLLFSFLSLIPLLGQIAGAILQFLYSFAPAIRYYQINEAFYGAGDQTAGIGSQAPVPPSAQPPVPPTPAAPAS